MQGRIVTKTMRNHEKVLQSAVESFVTGPNTGMQTCVRVARSWRCYDTFVRMSFVTNHKLPLVQLFLETKSKNFKIWMRSSRIWALCPNYFTCVDCNSNLVT